MAKKDPHIDISQIFTSLKDNIALQDNINAKSYIPDIIEFCNSERYLNLPAHGIELFPMQKIILRCFYRGQKGNEHIKLTADELKLLKKTKQDNVIKKYFSNELFRELVLVLGRRASKDFMVSLMALYEAMKLLEIPGGCPCEYYSIGPGNPIYILTVATSSDQAHILFTEIKVKMQQSEYFRNKIGWTDSERVWLLTPKDRQNNKELISKGMEKATTKGTVVIMSGHSNSDSLLGKRYFSLLLDEVASFKTTGSAGSGDRIYQALGPGTVDFNRPVLSENGEPVLDELGSPKKTLDSKIMSLSSPRGEEGIFYRLYKETPETKGRLAFKLPTWKVNESITESLLRNENKYMSPTAFAMEFGAEFASTGGEKFIPDRYVDEALEIGSNMELKQRLEGRPGQVYYAHLDPASTSHNYALIILHIEDRVRIIEKDNGIRVRERFKMFVVDHIMAWHPPVKGSINVKEVDEYIIDLARRFRFGMVTYDVWQSLSSTQKLRSKGIPTKVTPYRKQYKMAIYEQLENAMVNHQLALPRRGEHAVLLEQELKCLKRIFTPAGFKIQPDPEAPVTSDDIADALAGAIGTASERAYMGYPKGVTVHMPQSRGDQPQWNIGRGSYGSQQWQFVNRKFGKLNPYGG